MRTGEGARLSSQRRPARFKVVLSRHRQQKRRRQVIPDLLPLNRRGLLLAGPFSLTAAHLDALIKNTIFRVGGLKLDSKKEERQS